ncbi:MAG: DUF2804 domain-containing protein [Bradymonadaceae bacterium]
MSDSLESCPDDPLDEEGRPRAGTYRGRCRSTDLSRAVDRLERGAGSRLLREKQWQSFAVADRQVACGGTLLDAQYATTLFLWVFDRLAERMIADEAEVFPPFVAGIADDLSARRAAVLRGLRRQFAISREDPATEVEIDIADIHVKLELHTDGPPPLTAICPIEGEDEQGVNITQKQVCLPARGHVSAEGRTFDISEPATGYLDHSHGLLNRETEWDWAIAGGRLDDGSPIGFNLSSDFTGCRQNAVWLGDDLRRAPPVTFDFDTSTRDPRVAIRSEDGSIDLSLSVETTRRRNTDLRVITSDYLQPIGRWHGRLIDREAHDLFGLAERHRARW